ncbi:TRAFAC clade GTPase domain-containing protein [Amphritea balenae]|uniref:Double-GTPase 2 domain-containing protein n=1 Tax=Amphritea balenae TaxID=452629 RepID=A0A3P1SQR0_9GAMM|nr:GTPase [Amphritea balenae]RRC98492.1 hypothetical protein EHS89_12785 [Amphritea balenae]GGK64955.1 hypothetical protein GCM10007941_13840 [Amphritea balenae]
MNDILDIINNLAFPYAEPALVGILIGSLFSAFSILVMRKKLPVAHSIAVIGLPRTGKTTLVTSIFAEIFSARMRRISLTLRGDETIKKVNDDIARLQRGEELGPTTDQDLFAYRADMVTGSSIFSRRYKVEIGDFPGEDSEELASSTDIDWLQKTPFFRWAIEADAFLFVVDASQLISGDKKAIDYTIHTINSYRASWQKIKDHYSDGLNDLKSKPITLVFTKIDALDDYVGRDGSITGPVQYKVIDESILSNVERELDFVMRDLIGFFRSESRNFSVTYTSAFGILSSLPLGDNTKLGMERTLSSVLPKIRPSLFK